MSGQFFVLDVNNNKVPAEFLEMSGENYVDVNISTAQSTPLFDSNNNPIGNPSGFLIVPSGYTLQGAADAATEINAADSELFPGASLVAMAASFIRGGDEDLQRSYVNTNGDQIYNGPAAPGFKDAASFNLGFVTANTPYTVNAALAGGGAYNIISSFFNPHRVLSAVVKREPARN